ncbi:MAG: restriction endonuclease subunit S [Pseudomonadales bacterium]
MKAVAVKKSNEAPENGLMQTTLGAIGEYINGRGFKKSEWSDSGLPIIRIQDLTGTGKGHNYYNGEIAECHVVEPGDLLISWSATLGVYIWDGPKAALNQHIFKVVSKIDKKLHYYLVQHILEELYRKTHGSGMVHITKGKFEETPVSIPESPEQQKQIVAKIEELFSHIDAGIDALKQSKQLLKQYRQSVLKAAVTGELSKEWREQNKDKLELASKLLERILQERRQKWEAQQMEQFKAKGKVPKDDGWKAKYKEPSAPDAEGFPEIPEEWIWSGFEQVASPEKNSMKAGPFGSALKKQFYTESGYKIYGQEQVINGDPYYGDYYISEDKYQSLISCAIKPGDFLISLVGTIGKTLVLPEDCEPGIINPRLIKITFDKNICQPNYAKIYVSSPVVKGIFSLSSHGGTMDVLNMNSLKSLPFPLPSLYEQKIICVEVDRIFTVIESMEKAIDYELQRSERLKQSVLQSAFGGNLIIGERN